MEAVERGSDAPYPSHFDGRRYFNPGAAQVRGFAEALRWKLTSRAEPSPRWISDVSPSIPPRRVEGTEIRLTLINHSTVLIQTSGRNILTDPMWSGRASPVNWAGPRRRRAPGVRWEDLPPIDLVLLSHNHYDHFDVPTLRRLAQDEPQFIVPCGLGPLLSALGIRRKGELDWGASASSGPASVHAVPAFHFSARSLFDRNRTLWCGFVLELPGGVVYFAGDTAFGEHFSWIRNRFGPPRAALLPIGAYQPRWFMSPAHMDPQEAICAHRILGAETSIAIHHGTFQLGDEGVDDPRRSLEEMLSGESIIALANGEFLTLG